MNKIPALPLPFHFPLVLLGWEGVQIHAYRTGSVSATRLPYRKRKRGRSDNRGFQEGIAAVGCKTRPAAAPVSAGTILLLARSYLDLI